MVRLVIINLIRCNHEIEVQGRDLESCRKESCRQVCQSSSRCWFKAWVAAPQSCCRSPSSGWSCTTRCRSTRGMLIITRSLVVQKVSRNSSTGVHVRCLPTLFSNILCITVCLDSFLNIFIMIKDFLTALFLWSTVTGYLLPQTSSFLHFFF